MRMISRMLVSGVAIAVLGTLTGSLAGCATESSRALPVAKVESATQVWTGVRIPMAVGKFDNRSSYMRGIFSDGVEPDALAFNAGTVALVRASDRKARLVRTVRSHGDYRLYVLPNSAPTKPGLVFDPGFGGDGVELEIWAMPEDTVGSFLLGIPAPLCLGTVLLEDGNSVKGFLCEPAGVASAEEITHLGGWRRYMETLKK